MVDFRAVGITGVSSFVPERVVTNDDIVKMGVDTSDEWIRTRTGISERRWANENQATSDLATEAAKKLLKQKGMKPEEIDLIIVATCSPDTITPSTACYVQHKLGAVNAGAVDVNNACSGFNYSLAMASKFVADSTYNNVLLIGAECPSKFLSKNERTTFIFFGDGAGAVLLQPVDEGYGVLSSYLRADGAGAEKLIVPQGGTAKPIKLENYSEKTFTGQPMTIKMDGRGVWEFAMNAIPDAIKNCTEKAGLKIDDIDFFIFHQANLNIIHESMKNLGLPLTKLKNSRPLY